MLTLSEKIDKHLKDLAWSLWTELGVAGLQRKHQNCLIAPEELILLTAALAETDPRLRDEALDWCSRYHSYISISRMRILVKMLDPSIEDAISSFNATLNAVAGTHWPLFTTAVPLKFVPSGKSKAPVFASPALLCLRMRALFGITARADIFAFFLMRRKDDFTISDVSEIGYGKRHLAEVLENLAHTGILESFMVRNQKKYRVTNPDLVSGVLGKQPQFSPSWLSILDIVLTLRNCIQRIEKKSEGTKIVEIRNTLMKMQDKLKRMNLSSPLLKSDFSVYWDSLAEWILSIVESLAVANFKNFQ